MICPDCKSDLATLIPDMSASGLQVFAYYIRCSKCGREVYEFTKQEAIEAWNKEAEE